MEASITRLTEVDGGRVALPGASGEFAVAVAAAGRGMAARRAVGRLGVDRALADCRRDLVAEEQFRRIIGYRDLAKLVITAERHTLLAANSNSDRQEIAQSVTV